MRIAFRTVEKMVQELVEVSSIIATKRGKIFRTEELGDFRIALVDGRDSEQEQGIHIRKCFSKHELKEALSNALEEVSKDNWYTIWIHQEPKPSKAMDELRKKALQGWIEAFEKRAESSYSLDKLHIDLQQVVNSFDSKQLEVVLALIIAAYAKAGAESREFRARLKAADQAYAEGDKDAYAKAVSHE